MTANDAYQSSIGSYNSSSCSAREALDSGQAYYEPEVLMTGQVWVNSGLRALPLLPRSSKAPPRVVAPVLDAQAVAEKVARQVGDITSIESVCVQVKPWGFECLLVANCSTEDERFQLYDLEWQLMELMPSNGFKFQLVDRQNRPLGEFMTLGSFDAIISVRKTHNA